jgi:hypothetical protein
VKIEKRHFDSNKTGNKKNLSKEASPNVSFLNAERPRSKSGSKRSSKKPYSPKETDKSGVMSKSDDVASSSNRYSNAHHLIINKVKKKPFLSLGYGINAYF